MDPPSDHFHPRDGDRPAEGDDTLDRHDGRGDDVTPAAVTRQGRTTSDRLVFTLVTNDGNTPPDEEDARLHTDDIVLDRRGIDRDPDDTDRRYHIRSSLGQGGYGQVFAVFDATLRREIAIKFLHPHRARKPTALARFVREAQLTASLSHPNILPIYDLDRCRDLPYFSMRKAEGLPLAQAIDGSTDPERPHPAIDGWFERAEIMVKVCDAVAYAHSLGVIHQDIKPDNIILGHYGEVMLIDWGTATTNAEIATGNYTLQGTPAYMAPEQARRQAVDERSDIYALGATLFHLLTLRLPLTSATSDRFWDMKRQGAFDQPTTEEVERIPEALLAIALQAMASDATGRYQSVSDMRDDLRRFQSGLAVSAHHESLGGVLRRFVHRHAAALATAATALLLIAAAIGLYAWEKSKEATRWHVVPGNHLGTTTDELAQRWHARYYRAYQPHMGEDVEITGNGRWVIEDEALFYRPHRIGCNNLIFSQPLPGNLRVSWTVTALSGGGNLNCFIAGQDRFAGYTFHVAGYGDQTRVECTRLTQTPHTLLMDRVRLREPIILQQPYRMVMERENDRIRLLIDGETILDFRDHTPLSGTANHFFGFESSESALRIDDLVIERQPLPQRVDAIAVADGLFAEDRFDEAILHYRGIITAFPHSEMALTARYRIALCHLSMARILMGDPAEQTDRSVDTRPGRTIAAMTELRQARSIIETFLSDYPQHHLRHPARAILIESLLALQDIAQAETVMNALADDADTPPALARIALQHDLNRFVTDHIRHAWSISDLDAARQLLQRWRHWESRLGVSLLANRHTTHALELLVRAGYAEEVLNDYNDQQYGVIAALRALDRHQEILDRFGHIDNARRPALWGLGRYRELLAHQPNDPALAIRLGLVDEWLARDDLPQHIRVTLLLHQKRYPEVYAIDPGNRTARIHTGRGDTITNEISTGPTLDAPTGGENELALLLLHRVEEVYPWVRSHFLWVRRTHQWALLLHPLAMARQGRLEQALEEIRFADERPRRVEDYELANHIMIPFARHVLEDDWPGLRERWLTMRDDPRFAYGRVPSLLDSIIDGLPYGGDQTEIGIVLSGLHAEWLGDRETARRTYEGFPLHTPAVSQPADGFVRWRLHDLTEE